MSSTNVENWYAATEQRQAVRVANGSIIRPISIDPDWTTLQIGLWCSWSTGSLANWTGTPRLYMGLCSGDTNVIGDPTVDHFLGFRTYDDTWVYTSSSTYTCLVQYNQFAHFIRYVGTAISSSGDFVGSNYVFLNPNNGSIACKSAYWFLQITRGSPNYSLTLYYPNSYTNTQLGQVTETDFFRELQSKTPTTTANCGLIASATVGLECSEATHGTFDHICVAWDQEEPVADMIVYGIGATVLA